MPTIDRDVVPKEQAREAVEGERSDGGLLRAGETVSHLRKVLYPVYVVDYTYNLKEGRIRSRLTNKAGSFLIDGFPKDENLTANLQEFQDTASELQTVDSGYFSDSFVIRPFVGTGFAQDYLKERIVEVKHSTTHAAALSKKDGVASPWDGKPNARRLKEQLRLPDGFSFGNFVGTDGIRLVYVPFWVARFRKEDGSSSRFLCFRDVTDGYLRGGSPDEIRWMTEYFATNQTVRSPYLDTDTHEIDIDRGGDKETSAESRRVGRSRPNATHQNTNRREQEQASDDVSYSSEDWQDSSEKEEERPGFQKVGGMGELKETLRRKVIEPLENEEKYREFGLGVTNGVLLYGPPGTGKTHITQALAEELGYGFVEIEPSDIVSRWTGEAPKNIKRLFDDAVENQPCVVFIDEIDAVASERDGRGMNQSQKETVNQLLNELSRVQDEDVVVVGATNKIGQVDEAIKRSGRFDEKIEVPLPDDEGRKEVLRVHLRDRPVRMDEIDWDEAVEKTAGYTASDLELVAENAAEAALHNDREISHDEVVEAIEKTERSTKDMESASRYLQDTPGTNFSDVGGMEGLKTALRETVIRPLRNPKEYEEYGVGTVNGILLHGPPGCGKTYVSEALAGELGYNYVKLTPSDITSKFVGEGAETVSEVFEVAKTDQPCMVFIDEIDAVAGARQGDMTQSQKETVNQLLNELSEVGNEDVIVVAATNLLDAVDEAIRRSGRFDEEIEVPPPDREARKEVLRVHLRERPVEENLDWDGILKDTEGYAASDMELIAERAARNALKEDSSITTEHLVRATERTDPSI
jgi:SpoVK/Ycf46/Vps4 family AAA+-type ATPase